MKEGGETLSVLTGDVCIAVHCCALLCTAVLDRGERHERGPWLLVLAAATDSTPGLELHI